MYNDFLQPFCAQTTDKAPLFTAEAYDNVNKKMKQIHLESYRGKWVILFFYASNFTFV
ncbi:redoxin domain-containing protein [Bacillus sp. B15-48]|nr:redoxin domain-containing protein [Bacillus sp. B15-48]